MNSAFISFMRKHGKTVLWRWFLCSRDLQLYLSVELFSTKTVLWTSASVIAFASLLCTSGWASSSLLQISVPYRSCYENFRLISMYMPGIKYLMETLFCHLCKWKYALYFRLHSKHTVYLHSSVFTEVSLTMLKSVGWLFNPHLYRRLDSNTKDSW